MSKGIYAPYTTNAGQSYSDFIWDEPVLKEFTIKEIFEALKKNGLEHIRRGWEIFGIDGLKPIGACALGQAGFNLGVVAKPNPYTANRMYSLYEQLRTIKIPSNYSTQYGYNCADVIVNMNDAMDEGEEDFIFSYEEIVKAAEEILTPHFKETLKLEVREWA